MVPTIELYPRVYPIFVFPYCLGFNPGLISFQTETIIISVSGHELKPTSSRSCVTVYTESFGGELWSTAGRHTRYSCVARKFSWSRLRYSSCQFPIQANRKWKVQKPPDRDTHCQSKINRERSSYLNLNRSAAATEDSTCGITSQQLIELCEAVRACTGRKKTRGQTKHEAVESQQIPLYSNTVISPCGITYQQLIEPSKAVRACTGRKNSAGIQPCLILTFFLTCLLDSTTMQQIELSQVAKVCTGRKNNPG